MTATGRAVPGAVAASAHAGDDAKLLALAARWHANEFEANRAPRSLSDAERERWVDVRATANVKVAKKLAKLPARTPAGVLAKLQISTTIYPLGKEFVHDQLIRGAIDDLTRLVR